MHVNRNQMFRTKPLNKLVEPVIFSSDKEAVYVVRAELELYSDSGSNRSSFVVRDRSKDRTGTDTAKSQFACFAKRGVETTRYDFDSIAQQEDGEETDTKSTPRAEAAVGQANELVTNRRGGPTSATEVKQRGC